MTMRGVPITITPSLDEYRLDAKVIKKPQSNRGSQKDRNYK